MLLSIHVFLHRPDRCSHEIQVDDPDSVMGNLDFFNGGNLTILQISHSRENHSNGRNRMRKFRRKSHTDAKLCGMCDGESGE